MTTADHADTVREAQLERITRAFGFVPLGLYDDITKLAEMALGEILSENLALVARAEELEKRANFADAFEYRKRAESAETHVAALSESLTAARVAQRAAEAEAAKAWEFEHKMMERATEAEEKLEAAEDERDRLADALRFYANEDDYLWHGDQRGTIQKNDRGAVARAALARTEDTPEPPPYRAEDERDRLADALHTIILHESSRGRGSGPIADMARAALEKS